MIKQITQTIDKGLDYLDKRPSINLLIILAAILLINQISSIIIWSILIIVGVRYIGRKLKWF